MKQSILTFDETGTCHALKSDIVPLETLGSLCAVKRVSHVLPAGRAKRLAFRFLRFSFGERGRLAEWARQWKGPWQVRWAASPHIVSFTHESRRVCIDWEIDQLVQASAVAMQKMVRR